MSPEIIINPIGGLANRMRAIAAGITLARQLNVDYSIIWSKNWELNAEFTDIFKATPLIHNKIKYPNPLQYSILYSMPRLKNAHITSITLKRF